MKGGSARSVSQGEVVGYVGLAVGLVALAMSAAMWRRRRQRRELLRTTRKELGPVPWWANVLALVAVGGMVAVAADKASADDFSAALEDKSHWLRAVAAPACGLTLVRVDYPAEFNFRDNWEDNCAVL